MSYLAFSGFFTLMCGYLCGFIVFLSPPRSSLKYIWSLFSFSMGTWGFGFWMAFASHDVNSALFWFRFLNVAAIAIPVLFFHFVVLLLDVKLKKNLELVIYYICAVIYLLSVLIYPETFVASVLPKLGLWFYPSPGVLYYCFPVYFIYLVLYAVILLGLRYRNEISPLKRAQIKYVLIGSIIGFCGGSTSFPLVFGFDIFPFGIIQVPIYLFIITYAIIRFRLMDINIVLTRVGIFITVYSLCLGIPIWLGLRILGVGLWLLPIGFMGFFSTLGPFIYFYFQERAEGKLLQEQRRYQTTLRQASAGMGKIKNLKKLLNLIVYVVTRAVRIEHAVVYVLNEDKKKYTIAALKERNKSHVFLPEIAADSPLLLLLSKSNLPVMYEEIKHKADAFNDQALIEAERIVSDLKGDLVFPIQIESKILAIIVLGKKESGKLYNEDDLSVFSILANQAALAIENAQFYEDMTKTHEQLFQAEKMATIGTMADGLSHQINNRFHALGFIAGDALDTIQMSKKLELPDKAKEILNDLEMSFSRVQENVVQGGEIVQGLLRYTRKGDAGFAAVDFDAVFKSAFEMAQFKIKVNELKVEKDYDPQSCPRIKGNFTQLQEVFFNLIDNGYDAMMQRKSERKEPGYHPTLKVSIHKGDQQAVIVFEDNGIGVRDEDMNKLFTPFFTTKLSSKKGTGLGLYVIKKIIEDNHKGKVEMFSKYMVGTQMKLTLPVALE